MQTFTVSYNHERFIRDCLEGILNQETTFPVEVLIHDDASTDGTAQIIKGYEARYPRLFRALYQDENQYSKPGRGNLWETILNARRGKYIANCEGDDFWTDPHKLQRQVEYLESHPDHVMSSHDVETIWLDGIPGREVFVEPLESAGFEEILQHGLYIPFPSMVYLREAFPETLDWPFSFWALHWPMILLITTRGKNYHFDRVMARKQKHSGGITQDPERMGRIRSTKITEKIRLYTSLDEYTEHRHHRVLCQQIAQLYRRVSVRAFQNRQFVEAARALFLSKKFEVKVGRPGRGNRTNA